MMLLRLQTRLFVVLTLLVLVGLLAFQLMVDRYSDSRDSTLRNTIQAPQGPRRSHSADSHHLNGARRKYNDWYTFEPLPASTVRAVDRFVFFVGYARSGHSIIASMLDAHPNVVLAHEYNLFSQWEKKPDHHSNKTWLFNALYNSSRFSSLNGLRQAKVTKKGYTLAIPGWYQGMYESTINVIGDKAGGLTAQVYRRNKNNFVLLYQQLQATVKIPLHAIHVVRNPYDNIATMLLYNEHVKHKVNESHRYFNEKLLKGQIIAYFNQVRSVLEMIDKLTLNVVTIHHSDFVANPKSTVRKLCLALFIPCSEFYLHMVADNTFSSESHSQRLVQWTPELLALVAENIKRFPLLKRYAFN